MNKRSSSSWQAANRVVCGLISSAATIPPLSFLFFSASATASSIIVGGPWYQFFFDDVGTFASACDDSLCKPGPAGVSVFAGDSPYTFSNHSNVIFEITDAFIAGDAFRLFDFGFPVGETPLVDITGADCGNDPNFCFTDPLMSQGAFLLPPGAHSLSIQVTSSPLGEGSAFFRVDTVPEPASLLLVVSGLCLGRFLRKRRASS